ncbi:hypothetical protein [Methanomicrobium mobile]|uniref:hypothetical protein n=1 Tax=Methanomicrobium mobile TaxID=2205 RepID=UPI0005B2BB25|nr:hypothetical protein [Methanomicrobium mobile]
MKTLVVSDVVYNELYSRRIGREAISKTIMRELKPVEKCNIREELEQLRKEKGSRLPEVKSRLGL